MASNLQTPPRGSGTVREDENGSEQVRLQAGSPSGQFVRGLLRTRKQFMAVGQGVVTHHAEFSPRLREESGLLSTLLAGCVTTQPRKSQRLKLPAPSA